MDTSNVRPTDKVTAATAGAAASVVVVWAVEEFGHVDVPTLVAGAIATLAAGALGWLTKERHPAKHAA